MSEMRKLRLTEAVDDAKSWARRHDRTVYVAVHRYRPEDYDLLAGVDPGDIYRVLRVVRADGAVENWTN